MTYKKFLNVSVISALVLTAVLATPALAQKPVKDKVAVEALAAKDPGEKSSVDFLVEQMKPAAEASADKNAATAFTLQQALAEAYRNNPDLKASRAELRAVDESYAQALSGYRPSVTGETGYASSHTDGDTRSNGSDPKTITVEVVQPLYRGGTTGANVRGSDYQIKAQRALLQVKEQEVLLTGVSAYLAVIRDQKIVELNTNNESVLKNHLDASRQRFKLGDITKTDVSQSESRLAAAVADRVAAEGNYKKSRADFERVIGVTADNLIAPATMLAAPASLEDAIAEAEKSNPSLAFARFSSSAQEATTRSISGELLPQLDLSGSVGRTYDPSSSSDNYEDDSTIALRATVPFYSGGGSTYSRVRQSRQIEAQRRLEINDSERAARQNTISAWETLVAANAQQRAREAQIEAAKTALNGVKLETDYGSRTTLDLLDAEQEYLDAQVAEVIALHDKIVASYSLLAATGGLTASGLKLGVTLYDPEKNFQNVKNQWFGARIQAED